MIPPERVEATGGTYTWRMGEYESDPIAYDASIDESKAALEQLDRRVKRGKMLALLAELNKRKGP